MTDDDLMEAEGDMDKLAGKIQQRTGDRREDIRKWLDERRSWKAAAFKIPDGLSHERRDSTLLSLRLSNT